MQVKILHASINYDVAPTNNHKFSLISLYRLNMPFVFFYIPAVIVNSTRLFMSGAFSCTGYLVQRFRYHRSHEVVTCHAYSAEEEDILYWSNKRKFSDTLSLLQTHEGFEHTNAQAWGRGERLRQTGLKLEPSTSLTWFCKNYLCAIPFAGWTNISQTKLAITSALTQARTKGL